jgi:hypothetical protein
MIVWRANDDDFREAQTSRLTIFFLLYGRTPENCVSLPEALHHQDIELLIPI